VVGFQHALLPVTLPSESEAGTTDQKDFSHKLKNLKRVWPRRLCGSIHHESSAGQTWVT
jgi:hypothetical protein